MRHVKQSAVELSQWFAILALIWFFVTVVLS